jgi:glucokinase
MLGLIGDIGATHVRFAIVEHGVIGRSRVLMTADYGTIADAINAYFRAEAPTVTPVNVVLAVASPVIGDRVALTNSPWTFSIDALRSRFGFRKLSIINDFTAVALAIPHLKEGDRLQVGAGSPSAEAPVGVIGPGTGLGVSALVAAGGGWHAVPGEGGHVTMPAADARESGVLDLMRQRFDHVSAERVLSGPGLVNLYNALCELANVPAASYTPAQITDRKICEDDLRCRDTVAMFCAMLGTVAGNLALTLGARGGIYLAGGIVPKLGAVLAQSAFRQRFEDKGRLRGYLASIPTYVVTHPIPAFVGAASLLDQT